MSKNAITNYVDNNVNLDNLTPPNGAYHIRHLRR